MSELIKFSSDDLIFRDRSWLGAELHFVKVDDRDSNQTQKEAEEGAEEQNVTHTVATIDTVVQNIYMPVEVHDALVAPVAVS
jgi:cytoskeletal protein RodZ